MTQKSKTKTVIDEPGRPDDWSLCVRDGEVVAQKTIPYDGVLTFTTEERDIPAPKKNSEYGMSRRRVIEMYIAVSDTDKTKVEILDEVLQA